MGAFSKRAAITGIGQFDIGRRLNRDPLELTLDACLAAIEHAGLARKDIDGLATYPGTIGGAPGFSGAGIADVHDALRSNLNWFTGGLELPGELGSVIDACMAVACGVAKLVLCFRSVWGATAQGSGGRGPISGGASEGGGRAPRAIGPMLEFTLPFRAYSAANWVALLAQRHCNEYVTTREQLAQLAINARKNAAGNPKAIYREPMALESYFAARMISTPFCLYDCDVPVDGATAVIVSWADTARDLRRPPLLVEAVGSALHGRLSWDQFDDLTTDHGLARCGRDAVEAHGPEAGDVDVAELYDGFSFIALAWLEALGFCGKGEGSPSSRAASGSRSAAACS